MRTNQDILDYINRGYTSDGWGTKYRNFRSHLSFHNAKHLFDQTELVSKEVWIRDHQKPNTKKGIVKEMLDYMPFAWEQANNEDKLACARSLYNFEAWLWLLGNDWDEFNYLDKDSGETYYFEELTMFDDTFYGKTYLELICKCFGWDYSEWDNGERVLTPRR